MPRVPKDTLTVVDNRTGKQYELPVQDGTVRAVDLRQIKTSADDVGLATYDPGFLNTAACRSAISYIDGDKGILRYRGYPIEQLAERSTFLETAYLLLHGELPSAAELDSWVYNVTHHTIVHESIKKFIDGFHHDAHPMGMFVSTVAALSTFYPEAKHIQDETSRWNQIFRLIAKAPTLAAFAHRHSVGLPYAYPDNDLSYTGNFLNMMFKTTEVKYAPNKTLERALDVLLILHADHEQNCSTSAMRGVGSSHADPYSAMAAAAAALYGPLHGGANEEVLRMLRQINTKDQIPAYIDRVQHGEVRLMGFGPRVYKDFDPRAAARLRPHREARLGRRARTSRDVYRRRRLPTRARTDRPGLGCPATAAFGCSGGIDGSNPGITSRGNVCPISFSMSPIRSHSSGEIRVKASPRAPARAVRPTRCTYTSGSVGTSKFTTIRIPYTSIPRAAMSVATSTSACPLRNASSVRVR